MEDLDLINIPSESKLNISIILNCTDSHLVVVQTRIFSLWFFQSANEPKTTTRTPEEAEAIWIRIEHLQGYSHSTYAAAGAN